MAINSIPQVNVGGSTKPYGGVVYGLSLQMGFSQEPSKLKLSIINENGVYVLPVLGSSTYVSFGKFKFQGVVWSYEIKQNINEKTLEIEIADNSIILDKYQVILWKRGFFNDLGKPQKIEKEVKLKDKVLLPKLIGKINPIITYDFVELKPQKVERTIYSAAKILDNIIYLGTEEAPNSICEIPNTQYTLDNLKNIINNIPGLSNSITFTAPQNYKASHEGSLREVLQAWSEDCGVDFYWDYYNNTIKFYSIEKGIVLNLPKNLKNINLIEESTYASMQGTFSQQTFAYTAKQREEFETRDYSYESAFTIGISPFPISWFLKNNDTLQNLGLPQEDEGTSDNPDAAELNLWGGRLEDDFLTMAFLGYIDKELRDLLCMIRRNFYNVGVFQSREQDSELPEGINAKNSASIDPLTVAQKQEIVQYLRKEASGDIQEIETFSPNLEDHDIYDVHIDDNFRDRWYSIEQEILSSYGSVYRHNIRGGTFYYCSPTINTIITSNVQPEPDQDEPENSDFQGRKIYNRGGTFSHTRENARDLLGLNDEDMLKVKLPKLRVFKFDNMTNKLKDTFPYIRNSYLLVVPKFRLVTKILGEFKIDITRSTNKMEVTVSDNMKGLTTNTPFNCNLFDENYKKSKCPSLQEEALEKEYKRLGIAQTETKPGEQLVNGLNDAQAKAAKFIIGKKKLTLCAPSDSVFILTGSHSIQVKKIYDMDKQQKIFFTGKTSKIPTNISKIDVLIDDLTSVDDIFMVKTDRELPVSKPIDNPNPFQKSIFKFAGIPDLNLSPENGLVSIDISYSSEGFITTLEYNSRAPKRTNVNRFLQKINSELNLNRLSSKK